MSTRVRVSPCFTLAMSRLLLHDGLGAHADAACSDDELAVLIAVLGHRLGEDELAAPAALLLPRVARLCRARQHIAGAQRAVVLEVLLGVEPAATTPSAATATATCRA